MEGLQLVKRITYGGGEIVTSDATAEALLAYATTVADAEDSVTVDITVLEDGGGTSKRTLILSSASQLLVADSDDVVGDEASRFPVPVIPHIGISGVVEQGSSAARTAQDVNSIMDELDNGLGR